MIIHKQNQSSPQSSQSGFTILESLMAVVVVSILMIAMAPVIALSVATRVQSRRVELATQAARTYIDGLSGGMITAPKYVVANVNGSVAAPTSSGSLTCTTSTTGYPYCQDTSTSSLYCIDLDNSGGCSSLTNSKDLVIQAFRTSNAENYSLGLRVYRANAFSDSIALTIDKPQTTFTAGIGNRKAPLIKITTEMNSAQPRLQDFCTRLGGCS